MEIRVVEVDNPRGLNLVLGQAHFIKSVEDLHEALVTAVPGIKFGIAFCEASGPALVRYSGTDQKLIDLAIGNAEEIGAGHAFIIFLDGTFPINVLNRIKQVPEVCSIYCATANAVQVVIAETERGRGILGVVDGILPKGVETETDIAERKSFLRKIGYKL
ncbi:adenosine-specific kinase [Candidatus Bipolaricaulota bacterium]|nr:adenosine-specific kinase [Candidatus Bipolaricaulota bacterium]